MSVVSACARSGVLSLLCVCVCVCSCFLGSCLAGVWWLFLPACGFRRCVWGFLSPSRSSGSRWRCFFAPFLFSPAVCRFVWWLGCGFFLSAPAVACLLLLRLCVLVCASLFWVAFPFGSFVFLRSRFVFSLALVVRFLLLEVSLLTPP